VTNSGAQHFIEGERRFFDQKIMSLTQTTCESGIGSVVLSGHKIFLNGEDLDSEMRIKMERRRLYGEMCHKLKKGTIVELIKYSMIGTSRDIEYKGCEINTIQLDLKEKLMGIMNRPYEELLKISGDILNRELWSQATIRIENGLRKL